MLRYKVQAYTLRVDVNVTLRWILLSGSVTQTYTSSLWVNHRMNDHFTNYFFVANLSRNTTAYNRLANEATQSHALTTD